MPRRSASPTAADRASGRIGRRKGASLRKGQRIIRPRQHAVGGRRFPRSAWPRIAELRSTGPRSAGPRSAGQRSAGLRSAGPRSAVQRGAGPQSAGPRSAKSQSAGTRSAKPQSAGPRSARSHRAWSRIADPRIAGPRSVGRQLRLPPDLSAAAIVCVRNEASTIGAVLDELGKLPLEEIIVVINGSTDATLERTMERKVTIVHVPEALGHDVGRAIGAELTQARILLFVDGDFPLASGQLLPFLHAVHHGADIALNQLGPYLGSFQSWDGVTRVKAFLNRILGRPELGASSLTCVPHALSRRMVDTVGARLLAVPPVAQAAAALAGLVMTAPASVDVIKPNRHREDNVGQDNRVARLIAGDHLEALAHAAGIAGPRLGWMDAVRKRVVAEGKVMP